MFMRVVKGAGVLAMVAAVLGGLVLENRLHSATHDALPQLHGRLEMATLHQPVRVTRDERGAPHIYARTDADAFFALGFVCAQERLFQMDIMRRIATGHLAEIVGKPALPADKLARVVGFERIAEETIPHIAPETLALAEAYVAGINAYLDRMGDAVPVEFRLLDYRPERWSLRDSLALGRYQAWSLSADWRSELLRAAIVKDRGPDALAHLMPGLGGWGPFILNPEQRDYAAEAAERATPAASPDQAAALPSAVRDVAAAVLALPTGHAALASNNWVVAGTKTASGKPILANDPHLALPIPSVWMEVRLKSPTLDVVGVMFPGLPFVALGHNRYVAWGATTTIADTQDLYIEQPYPADPEHLYVVPGGAKRYRTVAETIVVKGGGAGGRSEHVNLPVRITRHGPIINDMVDKLGPDAPILALRWTGAEPTDEMTAFLNIARATNWDEFLAAMDGMGTPIQNWVFASIDGDIGYIAGGRIPRRAPGHDPRLPVPGETDQFEWQGYIPTAELPQVLNPPAGYIVSANNKVVPPDYPYYVQDFAAPPYRAARIRETLADATGLRVADMQQLQLDDYLVAARRIVPHLVRAVRDAGSRGETEAAALAALEAWDYHARRDGVAATVFHGVMEKLVEAVLEDEVPPELWAGKYEREWSHWQIIDRMLNEDFAPELWDDRSTDAVETRDQMLVAGFRAGVAELATYHGDTVSGWTWGDVHQQFFAHFLSGVAPWLSSARVRDDQEIGDGLRNAVIDWYFGAGPFPLNGSGTSVWASPYDYYQGTFEPVWGVSWRHVIDMSDVTSARSVLTTGNSGHVASPYYRDQVPLWWRGAYHPMPLDFAPGEPSAADTLVLAPAPVGGAAS